MATLGVVPDGYPTTIDDFTLLACLADGGFANVFVASQGGQGGRPGQLAAVKVWKHSLDRPDIAERFFTEYTSTRKVKSGFMPEFLDAGLIDRPVDDGAKKYPWVATKLIAGLPLDEVCLCGPLPEETVWYLGAGIVTALSDIHGRGWVHRDLKPDNVLLALNGPWVIDLGLAHLKGATHLGTSAFLLGPWQYAPQEWWRGGIMATGIPADLHNLGGVLLFAATGHGPYDASEGVDRAETSPPDLSGLPAGPLRDLVEQCLARDEAERPELRKLRAEFDRRTDGAGRDRFPALLPERVMALLEEHLAKLATVTGTWGFAEEGWGSAPGGPDEVARHEEPTRTRRPNDSPSVKGEVTPDPVPAVQAMPAVPARKLEAAWSVKWTREVSGWVRGPLAVRGGTLVVASLDGSVAAVRTENGTAPATWPEPVRTGAMLHAGPLIVPDGVDGGTVYVGGADGRVHGLDLASGQDRVVLEAGAAIESTPVTLRGSVPGEDGSVLIEDWLFALSADGCLHSVRPGTGESSVLYRMGCPATGALAMSSGMVFAASTDGSVYAIDPITGDEAWRQPTGGQVLAAPLARGCWIYACGTDGVLRQLSIDDGHEVAKAEVGIPMAPVPMHCAPVDDEYRLYVGGSDGVIRAYDISHPSRESLDAVWEKNVDHEVAGLAAAHGQVYAAAGYRLIELDGETGEKRRLFTMDSLIGPAPVISGQDCYVASLGGVVTCLSLS